MTIGDTLFLYEFTTRSNFYGRLHRKIKAYEKNLPKIEERFGRGFVLFVCDVKRDYVMSFQPKPDWAVFTDYTTFKSVPIGDQLTAPVYIWCDGRELPLRYGLGSD